MKVPLFGDVIEKAYTKKIVRALWMWLSVILTCTFIHYVSTNEIHDFHGFVAILWFFFLLFLLVGYALLIRYALVKLGLEE